MKKLFIYFIFLSAFIFINCRKEENKPKNNKLVVSYSNGTHTNPGVTHSHIEGRSKDEFVIYTISSEYGSLPTGSDLNFTFRVTQGVPTPIIFDSTGKNQGISMTLLDSHGTTWKATQGTANVELYNEKPDHCPRYAKVTFNDVVFTNSPINTDTLWGSGIINVYDD